MVIILQGWMNFNKWLMGHRGHKFAIKDTWQRMRTILAIHTHMDAQKQIMQG